MQLKSGLTLGVAFSGGSLIREGLHCTVLPLHLKIIIYFLNKVHILISVVIKYQINKRYLLTIFDNDNVIKQYDNYQTCGSTDIQFIN